MLAVFGCSSAKYSTTGEAGLLPANSNPHLQPGDIINVANYSYLNDSFSALIKTPITLQNNYVLPAKTVITGECKNNNPVINKINNQQTNIEITMLSNNGYSLLCIDPDIKQLMVVADADLPTKILAKNEAVFRPVKFESSGYDFKIQQILSSKEQYKVIIAKQNYQPVIFENAGSSLVKMNFRIIESDKFYTFLADSDVSKFTLMSGHYREDIVIHEK